MFWRCKHCGKINDVLNSKSEEVQSLLRPDTYKAVCEGCGESSFESSFQPGPTLLDTVVDALAKEPSASRRVSDDNTVAIHDTPHVWGKPFDKVGSSVSTEKAPYALVEAMASVLGRGQSVIDIVSLDAPGAD